MKPISALVLILPCVQSAAAAIYAPSRCSNPTLSQSSSIPLDGTRTVKLLDIACGQQSVKRSSQGLLCGLLGLLCPAKPTSTVGPSRPPPAPSSTSCSSDAVSTSSSAPLTSSASISSAVVTSAAPSTTPSVPAGPVDVTYESCLTRCSGTAGNLPPTAEDCKAIQDAIALFVPEGLDSFYVEPQHIQALTFGTCTYYFFNQSQAKLMIYSFTSMNITATAAGKTCFPPVHPFFGEGLCSGVDNADWMTGVGHS
ncbi:hypothetical protein BDV98DRAFT_371768 [Pterulicium gracile]|uniref:Uncharacterized protein n=1 Tax=Pterulicium gracile TaxID=1884261 RepID=A0A5C3Q5P8_9AGAR|nr:hypothetical protein BDV98DRAFT_371768 [Pterula gracilis]